MAIEHALLGLVVDRPAHGYEIYQLLRAPEGLWQVWRVKQSQLYALLARLEEEGLLHSTLETPGARPTRKVFSLTDRGARLYDEWLRSPVEHGRQMRMEFMAKLYLALRNPARATTLIDAQETLCRRWLEELPHAPAGNAYAQSVRAFRRAQIESFLAWLGECREIAAALPQEKTTNGALA